MASNLRYIYIFLIHIFNQSKYFIAVFISFMFFQVIISHRYIGDWDYFITLCGLIIKYTNYVKTIFVIIIIIIIILI